MVQGGHTIRILDNTVSQTFHGSIYAIFSALNSSDNTGNKLTVSGNNVNTTVGNSGTDSASAIEIESAFGSGVQDIVVNMLIQGNTAVNNTTSGLGDTIEIVNRGDTVGSTATMDVTARGNTVTNNAGGTNSAMEIRKFASTGGTLTMRLDLNADSSLANNATAGQINITNAPPVGGQPAPQYFIEGMAAGAQSAAAVDTFLSARNTGVGTVTGNFAGTAACLPPP